MVDIGAGIMGGRSPYAFENIGQGILAGSRLYGSEKQAAEQLLARTDQARAQLQERTGFDKQRIGVEQQQVANTGAYQKGRLANDTTRVGDELALGNARNGIAGGRLALGQKAEAYREAHGDAGAGARTTGAIDAARVRTFGSMYNSWLANHNGVPPNDAQMAAMKAAVGMSPAGGAPPAGATPPTTTTPPTGTAPPAVPALPPGWSSTFSPGLRRVVGPNGQTAYAP